MAVQGCVLPTADVRSSHCPGPLYEAVRGQVIPSRCLMVIPTSAPSSMLLKKSLSVSHTRYSGVFLPFTDVRERFAGRSERSIFSPSD